MPTVAGVRPAVVETPSVRRHALVLWSLPAPLVDELLQGQEGDRGARALVRPGRHHHLVRELRVGGHHDPGPGEGLDLGSLGGHQGGVVLHEDVAPLEDADLDRPRDRLPDDPLDRR